MDRLPQSSFNQGQNPSTYSSTANHGNVFDRTVTPLSGSLGVNRADFATELSTGQKDQEEIGISSRAVALDVDTPAVAEDKSKRQFTNAGDIGLMIKPEALSPSPLKSYKASPCVSTAILSDKQVELIQKLLDRKGHKLKEAELMHLIHYISRERRRIYVPEAYFKSSCFMKEFVKNDILRLYEIPKDKITRDILLAQNKSDYSRIVYDGLPDELKTDHHFLIQYSGRNGIPKGTPLELAAFIYGHLDITAKIKSLGTFPDSFKNQNDDLYDELIRSGRIELKDLPEHIKSENKKYCLSQLSNGLCTLSEVPVRFITKEIMLDSLSGQKWYGNFQDIYFGKCTMFTEEPVFFEEVLVKTLLAALETNHKLYQEFRNSLYMVYLSASKRYKTDKEKLGLLLKKLVKTNPFILNDIEKSNNTLLKALIDTAKHSLLDILRKTPEVSRGFDIAALYFFFDIVDADNDFKTHVLNIVYPYFPDLGREMLPEEILKELDSIVLKSEPFDKGYGCFQSRKLQPDDPRIVIDYIEQRLDCLHFFNNKEYLEKCCTDPIVRQRLIHVLAQRLVANKKVLLKTWSCRLPRQLLDDTLNFLKDPALFFKLDSSEQLIEPGNPLNFQLPNTSAFELVVAAHAFDFHPAELASARQLQAEFVRAGETVFQRVYPGQHPLSLFEKEGTIVGGRTLAIVNGEEVDYYKFHRVGEFEA
ncbi:hypothetical protein, partial [Endozoicomonas sp. SESOKO4]|uniref:hypothetical protein n=1 Tax=Endozoicomonas sp. SESOKO4 TaxID=2828745 RepID=UPI0021492440